MNRRGFLSLLGLGAAGLVMPRVLPFTELIYEPAATLDPVSGNVFNLQTMTADIAARLSRIVGPLTHEEGIDRLYAGWHQLNVSLELMPHRPIGVKTEVEPIAQALGASLLQRRVSRFGKLQLPQGVQQAVIVSDDRIAVRGVQHFYINPDSAKYETPILRFDVLAA